MGMDFNRYAALVEHLKAGIPVLTVNARLARHLLNVWGEKMRSSGLDAWPTPLCLLLGAWMETLLLDAGGDEAVLGEAPSAVLWEEIVAHEADSSSQGGMMFGKAASKAAMEAYSLMTEYRIPVPSQGDRFYLTDETRAFSRWTRRYEGALKGLGFIAGSKLPLVLAALVSKGAVKLPGAIVLAGFDELTPAASKFIDAVKAAGTKVDHWTPLLWQVGALQSEAVEIRGYDDELDEVRQAARWARAALSDAPGLTIGFIAPQLERYREIVNREFAAELDPESVLPSGRRSASFNISLGAPLAHEPLVNSALDLLSIGHGAIAVRALSAAMMSPYFAVDAEHLLLSRIDLELREDNRRSATMYELRQRIDRHGSGLLAARMDAWLNWLRQAGAKKTPGQWAHDFTALLKSIGWLGALRLTSEEYQAFTKWNALLADLAMLDDLLGRISRAEASAKLRSMASSRMHQRETPDCRIQVLGMLESVGLYFDRIWLMGCTESALPAAPSPNPFIPMELQKRYGLPRSTHDKELAFARKALERIVRSAPAVIASYPKRVSGEERICRPSALLTEGAGVYCPRIDNDSTIKKSVHRAASLVHAVPDSFRVPVLEAELAAIRGGTTILKDQSLCPFRAFAFHRLGAHPFPTPEYGLSRMEQGRILHNALEAFWKKTGDSGALKKIMEHGALSDYISDIADGALKALGRALAPRLMELEKDRLVKLIKDWVQVELRRGPFKVKAVEVEKELNLCGLTLTSRLDRVDVLEDGKEVIIDYKSGVVKRGAWAAPRPREPQLLVYSLTGSFDAISFARLSPGECRFVGLSGEEFGMDGVKPLEKLTKRERSSFPGSWDALMAQWKAVVERLAKEFMAGAVQVDPNPELKGRLSPCEHCGLDALCRKAEVGLGNADDENGEDEDAD